MARTYDVIVDTPKHHYQGKVAITLEGATARIELDIIDVGSLEIGATREGKNFDVAGTTTINDQEIEVSAYVTTWANSIDCKAQTSIGEVTIYGTSTGYSAGDVLGNDSGFAGRWSDA